METQRQLQKVGLEGALIRILRNKTGKVAGLEFHVETDPRVNKLDIKKVAAICPTGVFTITEEEPGEFNQ